MAEQQLIDYIKKAKAAGQTDDQTMNLLYKNGWTTEDVTAAFAEINQPIKPIQNQPDVTQPKPQLKPQQNQQPQNRPQTMQQSQSQSQPKIQQQPQVKQQEQARPQVQNTAVSQEQPKVQPVQQYQPKTVASILDDNSQRMRPKSHWLEKILIFLLAVVILCGVGLLVVGQFYSISWVPFSKQNPDVVINKMLENLKSVKAYHTIAQISANYTENNVSQGKLEISTNSETDLIDAKNPKFNGNTTFNLTQGSAPFASFDLSAISVNNAAFVNLNKVIIPSSPYFSSSDSAKISGKWFKVDNETMKAFADSGLNEYSGTTFNVPSPASFDNSDFVKNTLGQMIAVKVFSLKQQLGDETINGKSTYHYLLTISNAKLKDFVDKLISGIQTGQSTENSVFSTVAMAQMFADSAIDTLGDTNFEIWIGKNDYMLYGVRMDKVVDLGKLKPNAKVEAKINVTNSDFNKAIAVSEPVGAQKIETVLLPLIKTQKIQSDLSQIGVYADAVFKINKTYAVVCKSGLLNGSLKSYGKQLTELGNDLSKQGIAALVCFANAKSYCISAELTDGTYVCSGLNNGVNSSGNFKCTSATTACFPAVKGL